jgi:hypothetical protein
MEPLFSPYTRYRDSQVGLEKSRGDPKLLQDLILDVSTEELLSADRAFTCADLYAITLGNGDTVLWFTPDAFIMPTIGRGRLFPSRLQNDYKFSFNINGKSTVALARSSSALLDIVDVVCRLLVANVGEVYHLELRNLGESKEVFFSAPMFASLAEQCQNLKALILENVTLDKGHCRALGDFSKPGLAVDLLEYRIEGAAATEALAEVLGRNQGPTKLTLCDIDNLVLANGLRGNSRLKSLTRRISRSQDFFPFTDALRENKGLVELNLWHDLWMSDETWDTVFDSLKTHPTLRILKLRPRVRAEPPLEPAQLKSRIQALVNMLKANMSIQEICVYDYYNVHELFLGSVIPYLQTNRLHPTDSPKYVPYQGAGRSASCYTN